MTILHKIRAKLYENTLSDSAKGFIAKVISEKALTIKEIAQSAAQRGGADLSAATIEHAAEHIFKEMTHNLCDGFSINTGYFTIQPLIKGVFTSPHEQFDPKKHSIVFDFQQGALLRKELGNVEVVIMGLADVSTSITEVFDVRTGSINGLLTPNRNSILKGSKVKIIGSDERNGIYFINQETGERIKGDPADIIDNLPAELTVFTPLLPPGTYQIEVTTQFVAGTKQQVKEPRTALFNKPLTVR
ncbi:MAG: DUF4469 domain-containing protein [Spirochaetaceae bacterium]|jgi:hypothetical protein|nr:DUF4469 domain-containing protein [Spirochaetaceae bacterium]